MAGTRRRSRISDASAAAQQRAASRTLSVAGEGAGGQGPEIVEVAESVDNGSPRPQSPVSRSAKGFCKKCGSAVGDWYNSFQKVTGTYHLPALLGSFSSQLKEQGRPKAASVGTELNGCTIQPFCCPVCSDTLGFKVTVAPDEKQDFLGRDFFKLSRIELRCEQAPNRFITVEPRVDAALEPPAVEDSPVPVTVPPAGDMEVDSRPQPPLPGPRHHYEHHDPHHHHQPLQQVEANRQSLPPPSVPSPSAPIPLHAFSQKSPSNPPLLSPAVKPVHDVQYAHPPPKEANATIATRTRELPPVMSQSHSHSHSPAEHRTNGQTYPRSPQEVQLDAIERLQTQISQNSSALVAQSRDMRRYEETMQHAEDAIRREFQSQYHHQSLENRRVDEAVGRMQHEMRGVRELLEALTREVQASADIRARGTTAPPGQSVSAQDSALELMAQQIAIISHKANEVDTLKITIEIMKNKIQRLEDTAAAAPAPAPAQPPSHQYASPREPSAHSAQSSHAIPSYHATPAAVPHINTPVHPAQRTQSYHSQGSQSITATPEASQRVEPSPSQGGWVTVNAGTKRTHPNGVDSPQESVGQPLGSPKRPKLAPIEPRVAYAGSQGHPQHVYEHTDADDSDAARAQAHTRTLPSQTHSIPESTLPSQHSHAAFVSYSTQETPSDDSWRPESQRIVEVRTPRGRGRGGGPGSRGGRGRKSMPAQVHPIATPEWEREDWQGVPESQISPDGYYSVARSSRGIIRRGSGGGGTSRGSRPPSSSDRAVSLGLQGVTAGVGIGLPADPYAHTKKTRTKPVRNADGILIRKDGRPDMRSQSSAANLRKVHARKEEHKDPEREFTPTNLQYSTTLDPETPSPTGYASAGQDLTASTQKKHNYVMSKIFPGGVDETTKEHDYARKVFEEDQDHTAQPRTQHHHHKHEDARRPLEIKREQLEHHLADTQSPNNIDVDMDRPEDHTDDEGQTPGGQSENSSRESQIYDTTKHEEQQAQPSARQDLALAPKPTVESSQTLAASSAQTG